MASTSAELFEAIEAGDVDAVRAMVGADPMLAVVRDEHGVSALMRARYRFDKALVAAIEEHVAELDVFEAASFGDIDRVATLLASDPSAARSVSADGFTPLHLATFFGQVEVVGMLIARGADVDARGRGWMTGTPLHSAASASHADVARLLLEAGADPDPRQDGGFTPLHAAGLNGNAELTGLLLDAGADVRAATDDGRTPRDLVAASGDPDTLALIDAAMR